MKSLQKLMNEICEWSDKTFDNGKFTRSRCIPISYHLQKESVELTEALLEFANNPTIEMRMKVGKEYADLLILLVDSANHFGLNADELLTVAFNKLEENKKRKWGLPDENGVVEHIRE